MLLGEPLLAVMRAFWLECLSIWRSTDLFLHHCSQALGEFI